MQHNDNKNEILLKETLNVTKMAIEASANLFVLFLKNSFNYMQLWIPLFIIYKLIHKYSDQLINSQDGE